MRADSFSDSGAASGLALSILDSLLGGAASEGLRVGFFAASASPSGEPIFNSAELWLLGCSAALLDCGAGSSPDSVAGFFEERAASDGEDAGSEGASTLVDGLDSNTGAADSVITFPYMSIGMRRVTILGTNCISVVCTVLATR